MDLEFLNGKMGENMSENGKKENNMEKGCILMKKEKKKSEFGLREKEWNGSWDMKTMSSIKIF